MDLYFGGGINEQIAPLLQEAATGSYNFELNKDTYQLMPRLPWDLADTLPNGKQGNGMMQLITRAGNESTLVEGGGQVYRWYGNNTFSAVGTCATASMLRDTYWPLDDYIVATDMQKATTVRKWNGTSFTTQTTGLGATDLYAKYAIVHLGRMWYFNVKAGTDTPHLMVASAFEDPTSLSILRRAGSATVSTGLEAFYMLTPDLREINGVCLFHQQLIISTKRGRLFKLTGTSGLDFAWEDYYTGSQAIGDEAVIDIGNDVAYMKKGGGIDLLSDTQKSGDVEVDDISRWIPKTVKDLLTAIAVYDQSNQKVLFFIDGKVLVFFKDIFYGGALTGPDGTRTRLSPWSVYKTQYADDILSSINSAKYMLRPGTTDYTVYFMDASGRIIDMNGSASGGDAGMADIQLLRTTKFLLNGQAGDFMSHITRGSVEYRRTTECALSLSFDWGAEYNTSIVGITLKGPPDGSTSGYWGGDSYFGGSDYWSEAFSFANSISHQNFSPVGRGSGTTLSVSSQNTAQYIVDSIKLE